MRAMGYSISLSFSSCCCRAIPFSMALDGINLIFLIYLRARPSPPSRFPGSLEMGIFIYLPPHPPQSTVLLLFKAFSCSPTESAPSCPFNRPAPPFPPLPFDLSSLELFYTGHLGPSHLPPFLILRRRYLDPLPTFVDLPALLLSASRLKGPLKAETFRSFVLLPPPSENGPAEGSDQDFLRSHFRHRSK